MPHLKRKKSNAKVCATNLDDLKEIQKIALKKFGSKTKLLKKKTAGMRCAKLA